MFKLERFSFKLKQQVIAPKKIYCIDNGLISTTGFMFTENKGRLMENLVYIELLRRKKEIYYWKDHQQREVDSDSGVLEGTEADEYFSAIRDDLLQREVDANPLINGDMRIRVPLDDTVQVEIDQENRLLFAGAELALQGCWRFG